MPNYTTEAIRNLALVGHSSAGKTSFMEALLAESKMINTAGSVERGSTVGDSDPMEKEHQHSLDSAVAHLDYRNTHINLLDTPGYPDFRGPTLAATGAVETAAIVVNAQSGIELNTHRMMERARERGLCRVIVINKIDADGIDLTQLVRDIRSTFGDECLPINLPTNEHSDVVDVFFNLEGESDIFTVEAAHTEITDQVVEMDEELMETYLEQGKLEPDQLHDAFEQALREGHLVPICFVSSRTGAGIKQFLDLCVKLMPNPHEGNPPPFIKGEGEDAEAVTASLDASGHVLAHVFKITNDPFVGKLSVFRIYQGTVTRDSQLYIGDGRKPFKVSHLFKLQGKEHSEIEQAVPGDICAVAKVEEISYDAVLHDSHDEDNYHLKPLDFPQPMFGLAISPKSRGHEQKLGASLHKLVEEDPCFKVDHSAELNETVIRGLGDLHLRIMLERMHQRYNVEVNTRPPRIAYRETINAPAEGHYRHKKQTGGAGQFGEVFLRVAPKARGEGFEFENKVVGGAIPTSLIPAVEKGVRQLLDEGAVAGYPLQDIKVTVYDGKFHPVDSKEIAFVIAGKKAFMDAVAKASPQVLEPIVDITVTAPDSNMGDIAGSLSGKRARIAGTDSISGGLVVINALAPLSELSDFQTELKSVTGGQGRYSMSLSHYEPVPAQMQQRLVAEFKPKDDE
ncbi:MAG: elongation factor G [Xanthomonadales bacterium]|nr:elongation factor G [Xanthomonadales bacterium]